MIKSRQPKRSLRAVTILLSILSVMISLSVSAKMTFSSGVKSAHEKAISNDLKFLSNFQFKKDAGSETLKVMEIDSLDSKTLADWLSSRVSYVIHDQKFTKLKLFQAARFWDYEYPNIKPIIEQAKVKPTGNGVTVMSNIGTAIYYTGKSNNSLLGIKIKTGILKSKKVNMTSPRTGVIQIGEGLFMRRLQINRSEPSSKSNSMGRLATLFHEARHSDGHGKFLGFFHAVCPKGHDFEGLNACDRNLNGPYTVGANILKEFLKNCESCDEYESERLKLRYLDSMSRVITETEVAETHDDFEITSLKLLIDVQETMLSVTTNSSEMAEIQEKIDSLKTELNALISTNGHVTIIPSPFVDATAEGI
jgi:hypothetical protein